MITAESLLTPDAVLEIEDFLAAETIYVPGPPGRDPRARPAGDPRGSPRPSSAQPPSSSIDTLVDYGLPAGLRRELDVELNRPRPPAEAPTPGSTSSREVRSGSVRVVQPATEKPATSLSAAARTDRPSVSPMLREAETLFDLERRHRQGRAPVEASISRVAQSYRPSVAPSAAPYPHMPPPLAGQPPSRSIAPVPGRLASIPSPRAADDGTARARIGTSSSSAGSSPGVGSSPGSSGPPKARGTSEARSALFVVERSLDEAILSYLTGELGED